MEFILRILLIELVVLSPMLPANPVCHPYDLLSHCIHPVHLKRIWRDQGSKFYPQFQEIFHMFPDKVFQPFSQEYNTILSYGDNCELRYVKSDIRCNSKCPGPSTVPNKENPYVLKVSEIQVDGVRLNNWLHIKIFSRRNLLDDVNATGKIKMAFLVANDKDGLPVGDFDNNLPCRYDCQCENKVCHFGNRKNHFPCMFISPGTTTNPGMFMFFDNKGVDEIHASWRFVQWSNPRSFVTELHFRAIVVENFEEVVQKMTNSFGSHGTFRSGLGGWTPQYWILHPSIYTLGSWTHYRENISYVATIDCHRSIQWDYFKREEYRTLGNKATMADLLKRHKTSRGSVNNQYNDTISFLKWGEHPGQYIGPAHEAYAKRDSMPTHLYWGTLYSLQSGDKQDEGQVPGITTRIRNGDYFNWTRALLFLDHYTDADYLTDRCTCPAVPKALLSYEMPVPLVQIYGRKSHALQMSLAWIHLIPASIFVARFYKNVHKQTYFYQEHWWYTMHVILLIFAFIISTGAYYVLELRRVVAVRWKDPYLLSHIILGYLATFLFVIQLFIGPFRIWSSRTRTIITFLHSQLGLLELLLALTAIILAAYVSYGSLPCRVLGWLLFWSASQLIFFLWMQYFSWKQSTKRPFNDRFLHETDLELRGLRESGLKTIILVAYLLLSVASYLLTAIAMEHSPFGEACFSSVSNEG